MKKKIPGRDRNFQAMSFPNSTLFPAMAIRDGLTPMGAPRHTQVWGPPPTWRGTLEKKWFFRHPFHNPFVNYKLQKVRCSIQFLHFYHQLFIFFSFHREFFLFWSDGGPPASGALGMCLQCLGHNPPLMAITFLIKKVISSNFQLLVLHELTF